MAAKTRVTIFGDFAEDQRLSMDLYARCLEVSMRTLSQCEFEPWVYCPRKAPVLGSGHMRMRIARYIEYPLAALMKQGTLNHIVDQGYGHLLYALDRRRTVVTVHDVIPLVRFKGGIDGFPPGRKPYLNLLSFNALRHAAHIVAVSENTKRDLVALCGCPASNITVIYNGVDPLFRPYSAEERQRARRRLGLEGATSILVTGSGAYKNHLGALRALATLFSGNPDNYLIVKTGLITAEWTKGVDQFHLHEKVLSLGCVARENLLDLYNSVDCLLFPSFYEGFGWPPLEAMACGTPVIASNAASLPEIIGDAGIMVPPTNTDRLAQALHDVLSNPELRERLVTRGLARARQFRWESAAEEIGRVYASVLSRSDDAK